MKRWTQYLTWQFVERVREDTGCMAKVLCCEYRPTLAVLMSFYAMALAGLLTL
jgi:hypothetical protein